MRARAGDPPRTMPQKILAGRADDPLLQGDTAVVKIDQVVLTGPCDSIVASARDLGMTKAKIESAVAYQSHCVTDPSLLGLKASREAAYVSRGIQIARAGLGFAGAVHLERFASPARLALTDDPRLLSLGGMGMLTLLASPAQLSEALATGHTTVRTVISVQVLLAGKLRPFSGMRDAALELIRMGLGELIQTVGGQSQSAVILEFAGISARLLSVPDRAVLCGLAARLGAAGAVFVSDEKTEVYLRDQRRSKAHRVLAPDPGAPCAEVLSLDLGSVEPLLMTAEGRVQTVREREGEAVGQVVLGGDSGTSLKDLLMAAALLKSKRVPASTEFILAPPSRQMLEVLAENKSLLDLLATGVRLVEPDRRIVSGSLYPAPEDGLSLRSFDGDGVSAANVVVASPDTLCYAIATGKLGDPRGFKRPARILVPRALPTDDVLIIRKRGKGNGAAPNEPTTSCSPRWNPKSMPLAVRSSAEDRGDGPCALLLAANGEVQQAVTACDRWNGAVRALLAVDLAPAWAAAISGQGAFALSITSTEMKQLRQAKELTVSPPASDSETVTVTADGKEYALPWPALDHERSWVLRAMEDSAQAG